MFNPTKFLQYSLFAPRPGLADRPEDYLSMAYVLKAVGAGTMLSVIQEDPRPGSGAADASAGDEGLTVLKTLKEIAEAP